MKKLSDFEISDCPFCGRKPKLENLMGGPGLLLNCNKTCLMKTLKLRVVCQASTADKAVKLWNRRAADKKKKNAYQGWTDRGLH